MRGRSYVLVEWMGQIRAVPSGKVGGYDVPRARHAPPVEGRAWRERRHAAVQPLTRAAGKVHTARRRHAVVLEKGPMPQPLGRVPRVARLLALAHHFERLLAEGIVRTQGELAAFAGVTRPRVTQILNLLLLAPDIQEESFCRSRVTQGQAPSPTAPCSTWWPRPCGMSSEGGLCL